MRNAVFNQDFPSPEELCFRALKEEWFCQGKGLKVGVQLYQLVLQRGLRALSELEALAMNLRFVTALTIAQVADRLGMSWDGADELLERAIRKVIEPLVFESRTRANRNGARYGAYSNAI